jgi:hypothetical protein
MKLTINKKVFPDVDPGLLEDMLGVLPYWVAEYILYGWKKMDILEFMTERYGFGKLYQFKGKVSEDGTYKCAEDPDLPYVGKMNTPSGTVYFYQYAMLALPLPNGEYFVTRMD